jgi:hypothetical protein
LAGGVEGSDYSKGGSVAGGGEGSGGAAVSGLCFSDVTGDGSWSSGQPVGA